MYLRTFKEYDKNFLLNSILYKVYILLSFNILFSFFTAFISMKINAKNIGFLIMFLGIIFIQFLIDKYKNSIISLLLIFFLSGFIGFYTGPLLLNIIKIQNGNELILFSFFTTGLIFFGLSVYSFFSKKDFQFLESFIFTLFFIILGLFIFNIIFKIKLFYLVFSGFVIIMSSCSILYSISNMLNNGENNYKDITVSLYLNLYNIFINILSIFGIMSKED
jgi:modulator of FtsH protease